MTALAIVHDYLTQRGGAERVVLSMARAFPEASIHTSLYEPDATFAEFDAPDVHTMAINRVGRLRRDHRLSLPLLAPSFSATHIDADVVLCSSSGWAHGVRTDGCKIVYCHAPARWLYQQERYLAEAGRGTRLAVTGLAPVLRRWDRRAARSADHYLANSDRTRQLIAETYGIDAEVIHPPHGIDVDAPRRPVAAIDPGYFLCVSRLLPYKNVDAVIAAFDQRPEQRLVIVGRGPDADRLHTLAGPNITFIDLASDDELRWLYANAQALVGASYEDFGLTPVEAAAFGTPSIVLRFGGYLETVIEWETGIFFDTLDAEVIGAAVDELERAQLSAASIRTHAARFDEPSFARSLRRVLTATDPSGGTA
jgi:glycosyltransferase involved in cell wall biosynthesis